ncbi:MAG: (Fe-S)-binding protein [Thermodesulfobacteriota bacterium]
MRLDTLQNCSKCGLCLSVCPTYKIALQEHASPRARLQLIKYYDNKELISSPGLQEIISKCLMCGACAAICPSGINHYSKFMEMRTKMVQDHGEKIAIKSLVYLLASEYRIKFAAGFAKFGQRITPQIFFEKYDLGNIPLKRFPKLNKRPFREAAAETCRSETNIPETGNKGSVLYFTGCATNYLFDKTGFATINILKRMGYQVIIPEKQTCCGIPLLFHGAKDKARKNILTNIRCLNPDNFKQDNIKAIIVDCPTCGSALKNEYPALENEFNPETAETIGKISSKVIDIMSFVLQESGSTNLAQSLENLKSDILKHESSADQTKVTYHLPCHLKNSPQSPENSETILKNMPGLDYIRAVDADECCGGGGTFFYEYPEVSKEIVNGKIENAKKTGAEIWLTDCPVCRINLSGNLKKNDNLKVKHPVEMIEL